MRFSRRSRSISLVRLRSSFETTSVSRCAMIHFFQRRHANNKIIRNGYSRNLMTGFKHPRPVWIRVSGPLRKLWISGEMELNSRKSKWQPERHAFKSASEQGLFSQYHRCTLMPALMPILEEKWYQQSACWNSTGSCEVVYSSMVFWSAISPSHSRLSISIMQQRRDVEEKFWDCLATGSFLDSNGNPRITAWLATKC